MSNKKSFSKEILRLLGQKPAISIENLVDDIKHQDGNKNVLTAISRSLKGLENSGLVENTSSGQSTYARLTKDGRKKLHSIKLDHDNTLVDPTWDGKWRVILLDLPENRKDERDALRYLLKKASFVCLKNSVWISPFPYENLFTNIKKDFSLTTELMIFVTNTLDSETEQAFFELIK